MNDLLGVLGSQRYEPLSVCMTEDPLIMTLTVATNILAAFALTVIGVIMALRYIRDRKSPAMARLSILPLVSVMVFLSAASALSGIATIFIGVYPLDVVITAALGGISTAVASVIVVDFIKDREKTAEG